MDKARRLLRLQKGGATAAGNINASLRPTVPDGIDVVGLSTYHIQHIRTIYHAGLGAGKRRSVAMDLALQSVTVRPWTLAQK
eukprot:9480623-Pyramimonas_sp.AAC.1